MEVSQGTFRVKRRLDGAVVITCPASFVVPPMMAVQIAKAILKEAGVETVLAEPGQTVIRPPRANVLPRWRQG